MMVVKVDDEGGHIFNDDDNDGDDDGDDGDERGR